MADMIVASIQLKGGTKVTLESSDYIPLEREIIFDLDSGKYKLGNGRDVFKDLPYPHVDGITPTINFKGNWEFNGEDTGVKAGGLIGPQGNKGEKGDSGATGKDLLQGLQAEGHAYKSYTDISNAFYRDILASCQRQIEDKLSTLRDGQSAYEIAKRLGLTNANETDWIKSLKGVKGDKGDTGERGLQGIQGLPGKDGEKGDKGEPGTTDFNNLENKPNVEDYPTMSALNEVFNGNDFDRYRILNGVVKYDIPITVDSGRDSTRELSIPPSVFGLTSYSGYNFINAHLIIIDDHSSNGSFVYSIVGFRFNYLNIFLKLRFKELGERVGVATFDPDFRVTLFMYKI